MGIVIAVIAVPILGIVGGVLGGWGLKRRYSKLEGPERQARIRRLNARASAANSVVQKSIVVMTIGGAVLIVGFIALIIAAESH